MVDEKQQTIEKIKQTALEEFYENGYAKASLRTICRRAGVTTGAMYFHFENKEALLRALESLKQVKQSIENHMPEDFYSIDLMSAYTSLGSIIGEEVSDDLVNEIFSKFCMGK